MPACCDIHSKFHANSSVGLHFLAVWTVIWKYWHHKPAFPYTRRKVCPYLPVLQWVWTVISSFFTKWDQCSCFY